VFKRRTEISTVEWSALILKYLPCNFVVHGDSDVLFFKPTRVFKVLTARKSGRCLYFISKFLAGKLTTYLIIPYVLLNVAVDYYPRILSLNTRTFSLQHHTQ
jgi:hypothetical protein